MITKRWGDAGAIEYYTLSVDGSEISFKLIENRGFEINYYRKAYRVYLKY